MNNTPFMRLDLRAPLLYSKITGLPSQIPENEEILLHYELDTVQSRSIEPVTEKLIVSLLFAGHLQSSLQHSQPFSQHNFQQTVMLPAGEYLFSQYRSELPNQPEWLELSKIRDMAVEQQKDGLWERHKLKNQLYVRFLYEDGAFVTQIFRPIEKMD